MSTVRLLLFTLVLLFLPALAGAQFTERWATDAFFGSPGLTPSNLGDIDGDGSPEVVLQPVVGGVRYIQIRDALTGVIKFTSTTTVPEYQTWTTYLVHLDPDYSYELFAVSTGTLLIDCVGAVSTPIQELGATPEAVFPAQPNPFINRTSLSYTLANPGRAELEVYDVAGRIVRRLGGNKEVAGEHRVEWDGRDQGGRSLAPGVYFYRLSVDGRVSEAQKTVRIGP